MNIIVSALEQSVIFFPLSLGVYLSYAILKTTDMTTEGSFVLGAGAFARLLTLNCPVPLALALALVSGVLSGFGVSYIQRQGKINSLIAGIIGLFILYTLNFKLMARPNIGVENQVSFWVSKPFIFSVIGIITLTMLLLLATRFGLLLRAFGENAALLYGFGKNIEKYRYFGLGFSNALAALCGAFTAVINGFADLGMGFGMTLTAISTVMLGQQLQSVIFPKAAFGIGKEIYSCFLGVLLYFIAINSLLVYGLDPLYLKLVLGLVLIILLRVKSR
jgi:putative ABC transport system permease protein